MRLFKKKEAPVIPESIEMQLFEVYAGGRWIAWTDENPLTEPTIEFTKYTFSMDPSNHGVHYAKGGKVYINKNAVSHVVPIMVRVKVDRANPPHRGNPSAHAGAWASGYRIISPVILFEPKLRFSILPQSPFSPHTLRCLCQRIVWYSEACYMLARHKRKP